MKKNKSAKEYEQLLSDIGTILEKGQRKAWKIINKSKMEGWTTCQR